MNAHFKKMIAPIVVVIGVSGYYIALGFFFIGRSPSKIVNLFAIVVPAIVMILLIIVSIQRIKEIKKGEEDDLSKY